MLLEDLPNHSVDIAVIELTIVGGNELGSFRKGRKNASVEGKSISAVT